MVAWQERLFGSYGRPQSGGFDAQAEMEANYRHLTDDRLIQLRQTYNATHAILYANTPTQFPTLHQNQTYKIIQIK
jgi:hypothetical protein